MATLSDTLREALAELERTELLRAPPQVRGPQGPELELDGRRVVCLSSNDYLGLASDPALVEAAHAALAEEGVGAGASRLISGSMHAHTALERELARFTGREAAILFSSGWAANAGTLAALLGPSDVVLSDALNHASIVDGCRLSRARVVVYPHGDMASLEAKLREERPRARHALVVSDAIFSMDGDRAEVRAIARLAAAHDAWWMIDEAHALGVLGPLGRGLCAANGVGPDILMGTLGKAFGAAGAFVAGEAVLIRYLQNRARSHVFSTAPPPAVAAAALAAIRIAEGDESRRVTLLRHAARLRAELGSQGWDVGGEGTPIVPVRIGDPALTMRTSRALLAHGVFAHGIRPPTVPPGTSRIRAVPMATHTDEQITRAVEAFARVRRELFR